MDQIKWLTDNCLMIIGGCLGTVVIILESIPRAWKPIRSFIKWLNSDTKRQNDKLDKIIATVSEIQKENTTQSKRLDSIETTFEGLRETVDNNERDRLKRIIFEFGNTARKKENISSEEFRFLQEAFQKYTKLGGNDIAHDEYEFVRTYYNMHSNVRK